MPRGALKNVVRHLALAETDPFARAVLTVAKVTVDDGFKWNVEVTGPPGCVWAGDTFNFVLILSLEYPFKAPAVSCTALPASDADPARRHPLFHEMKTRGIQITAAWMGANGEWGNAFRNQTVWLVVARLYLSMWYLGQFGAFRVEGAGDTQYPFVDGSLQYFLTHPRRSARSEYRLTEVARKLSPAHNEWKSRGPLVGSDVRVHVKMDDPDYAGWSALDSDTEALYIKTPEDAFFGLFFRALKSRYTTTVGCAIVAAIFGCDILPKIPAIRDAVIESFREYHAAAESTGALVGDDTLTDVDSERLRGGALVPDSASADAPPADDILQPTADLDELLRDAAAAQKVLKATMLPGSAWAAADMSADSGTSREDRAAALDPGAGGAAPGGIAATAYDPGIKRAARIEEKVNFKYGAGRFDRVRDIARLALQYPTPAALKEGLEQVKRKFNVAEIENRFTEPTALGWSDITCLVKVDLDGGGHHIAELQLQLYDYVAARKRAHSHYRTIRSVLPDCGVAAKDLDHVQSVLIHTIGSLQLSLMGYYPMSDVKVTGADGAVIYEGSAKKTSAEVVRAVTSGATVDYGRIQKLRDTTHFGTFLPQCGCNQDAALSAILGDVSAMDTNEAARQYDDNFAMLLCSAGDLWGAAPTRS